MQVSIFTPPSDPNSIRYSLKFGTMKINLHQHGAEFHPCAKFPQPGSEDLCFILEDQISLDSAIEKLVQNNISVDGPYKRTGAQGAINSIYVRDPDGNLIELCKYDI